jgi:hypothetical protein
VSDYWERQKERAEGAAQDSEGNFHGTNAQVSAARRVERQENRSTQGSTPSERNVTASDEIRAEWDAKKSELGKASLTPEQMKAITDMKPVAFEPPPFEPAPPIVSGQGVSQGARTVSIRRDDEDSGGNSGESGGGNNFTSVTDIDWDSSAGKFVVTYSNGTSKDIDASAC